MASESDEGHEYEGEELYGFALESELAQKEKAQREIEEYGYLGENLVQEVFRMMKADKAFEIPERVIEQSATVKDQREKLLQPNAYREFKLPSMSDFMGESGRKFEKPLFEQSLKLRKMLFPITTLCCLIGNEELTQEQFSLMGAVANALRKEIVDDLRSLHLQRMAAKVPDSEARSILLADKHSVYHSETAQAALKQARTIKKANEAFKPKRMPKDWNSFKRRTRGGDQLPTHVPPVPPVHDASSASSSSSTPYDPNQGNRKAPSTAGGRGGRRCRGKRG